MLKQLFFGIALAGVVFLVTPPAHATRPHGAHSYKPRFTHHYPRHHVKRHVRSHHRHHHRRHRHHVHHRSHRKPHHYRYHRRHHRRHRHHRGVIGFHIGTYYTPPHYPHGHHLHVHDVHCPVIVHHHVHHYFSSAPVWEVDYYSHNNTTTQAGLHIIVRPYQGDVYVDGHFIGAVKEFRHGEKFIPLPPGRHTVRLRYHDRDYTQQIQLKSGNTAIVKAKYTRVK